MTGFKADGTPIPASLAAVPHDPALLSADPDELRGDAKRHQQGEALTAALDAIQRNRTGEST